MLKRQALAQKKEKKEKHLGLSNLLLSVLFFELELVSCIVRKKISYRGKIECLVEERRGKK